MIFNVGLSVTVGKVSDSSSEEFTVIIEDGPISTCSECLSVNDGKVSDSSNEEFTVKIEAGPISACKSTSSLFSRMS